MKLRENIRATGWFVAAGALFGFGFQLGSTYSLYLLSWLL